MSSAAIFFFELEFLVYPKSVHVCACAFVVLCVLTYVCAYAGGSVVRVAMYASPARFDMP